MSSNCSSLSCTVKKIPLANGPIATAAGATAITVCPSYPGCVRVGCYIYITGFVRQRNGNFAYAMPVLDVNTKTWNFIPCREYSTEGSGVFLYQDSLLIFTSGTRQLTRYGLATKEWSYFKTVGTAPKPGPYYSGDFLERVNRYILFGGYPAESSKRVYILDVPQGRWFKAVEKGTRASSRFQHGSCVHNGLIYIYGGWGPQRRIHSRLFILKVGTDRNVTWSCPLTANIGTLSSFVFIPIGRMLFFCGGMTEHGVSGISYYDTELRKFGKIDVPTRVSFGSGSGSELFKSGRSIAIFGGQYTLENMVEISIKEE